MRSLAIGASVVDNEGSLLSLSTQFFILNRVQFFSYAICCPSANFVKKIITSHRLNIYILVISYWPAILKYSGFLCLVNEQDERFD